MSLRNTTPLNHSPASVTDTLDNTNTSPGAMQALENLIPDPTTRNLWYCRPAAAEDTDFADFPDAGQISAMRVVGTIIYGMVASSTNPGKDEPFVYDTEAQAFIAVTGVSAANTPNSPSDVGEWAPPTMSQIGVYMVVTHPGFSGGVGNYFGWLDLSNPAAPVWDAGNTATNALPSVPVGVQQFSNRAYFAIGNGLALTDALDPLTITNASQFLTLGSDTPVTALGGLGLNTQLGGIVQALIAFKGVESVWQITGDPVTMDLAQNELNVPTGTLAPNTVTPTPYGLAFVSPQGLRVIDFQAHVSDPIGTAGEGMTVPFIYSQVPSRMCAAFNADVMRITVQNAAVAGSPWQEWWYHTVRKCWSGPHTSACGLVQPFSDKFALTLRGVDAKLFISEAQQTSTSVFEENGAALQWQWQTAILPDTGSMNENAMIETLIRMAYVAGQGAIVIAALNENGSVIDTVSITPTGSPSLFGTAVFGTSIFGGAQFNLAPRQVQWTIPIVFQCLSVRVQGASIAGFRIGNLWMRYEELGYLLVGMQA